MPSGGEPVIRELADGAGLEAFLEEALARFVSLEEKSLQGPAAPGRPLASSGAAQVP